MPNTTSRHRRAGIRQHNASAGMGAVPGLPVTRDWADDSGVKRELVSMPKWEPIADNFDAPCVVHVIFWQVSSAYSACQDQDLSMCHEFRRERLPEHLGCYVVFEPRPCTGHFPYCGPILLVMSFAISQRFWNCTSELNRRGFVA